MDEELYQLGRSGAGRSNIAMGYANLGQAIINGWMNDSDSSNIDRIGHRRWLLNPSMGATGFGVVDRTQSVYAFDFTRESDYVGVAWPARTMPTEFFGGDWAWSFSSGSDESRPKNQSPFDEKERWAQLEFFVRVERRSFFRQQ